jgi:hypothetical protein
LPLSLARRTRQAGTPSHPAYQYSLRRLGLSGELAFGGAHQVVVDQIPALRRVFFGAPAVISSRRSFFMVNDGCWWA